MPAPGPLLPLTQSDGSELHVHIDRIVKITPGDPEPPKDAAPRPEYGSVLTIAFGPGTTRIEVTQYLLNRGPSELVGFIRLTDLQGLPLKVNPTYVILARPNPPAGTMLEIHSSAGTESIYVRDSLETVRDWWASFAQVRLRDPNAGW